MPLLTVVFTLVAVAIMLFLLNKFGGRIMDPTMQNIIWWVIVVCTVLWVLQLTGIFGYFNNVTFPRVR